jgi:MFS family permease
MFLYSLINLKHFHERFTITFFGGSLLIWLVNSYTFLVGLSRAFYTALFNLYLKENQITNQVIGTATFYYSWGLAFGGFIFASLSDRIGRKKTILFTMPIYTLFGLLRLLNVSVAGWLYVVSFLFGFFDTSVIMPTITVIEHSDEKKRLRNSNINFAIALVTGVIGYFGAGVLGKALGIFPTLVLSMILAFVSVVPVFAFPDVKVSKKRVKKQSLTKTQKTMLVYYLLSGALVSLAAGVFINFGNVIFYDLFKFSTLAITAVLAVSQLSTAATSLFSHKLTARYGYKLTLFLIYLSVTLLIFTMPLFTLNSLVFSTAYVLRYVLINISTPMYMVFCLSYLPKASLATYSGLSYFLNNVMRASSAQLFASLSKNGVTDYNKLFLVSGFFYLANTLITLLAFYLIYKLSENETTSSKKFTKEDQMGEGKTYQRKNYFTYRPSKKTKNTKVSVHFHNTRFSRGRFNSEK